MLIQKVSAGWILPQLHAEMTLIINSSLKTVKCVFFFQILNRALWSTHDKNRMKPKSSWNFHKLKWSWSFYFNIVGWCHCKFRSEWLHLHTVENMKPLPALVLVWRLKKKKKKSIRLAILSVLFMYLWSYKLISSVTSKSQLPHKIK